MVVVALLGCLAIAGAWWVMRTLSPVAGTGSDEGAVRFVVAPGDTLGRVAQRLETKGLVRDARTTRWLARYEGVSSEIKAGEYALSPDRSTPEILEILTEGRVETHAITIPEGLRASEIADRLAEAELVDREAFLAIVGDPASLARHGIEGESLEGYLFPDTYRFARGLSPERIVDAMVTEFLAAYRALEPEAAQSGLSMRELVTLASIVEKETGAPEERPMIAAVFLNRLERGMRLETDPTVIYGIEDFDGNLKRLHLEDASNPYNTYRIPGLPPGPIASPGRLALEAVLRPADIDYLYFVSRNDGTHVFSKTYAEHTRNVDLFQRRRRR
jgi:UPF0755 protein